MEYFARFLRLSLILIILSCNNDSFELNSNSHEVWYKQAALLWEEALPIGNGRLGAMVFGNPFHERIQLNDDSLWPNDLGWNHPDGNPEDLKNIRHLLIQGDKKRFIIWLLKNF